jgi:hypothetical protein
MVKKSVEKDKQHAGDRLGIIGFMIAAMFILGILIVFAVTVFFVSVLLFLFAIPFIALILSLIQIIRKRTKLAIIGLILSGISLILLIIGMGIAAMD